MAVPKIELRTGEPVPRTIYRDLVNLPDPVKLGMSIRYFNHDDVALYFQITGSCAGYTFGTVDLNGGASLASGTDKYENLDEFASRSKPAAETTETITLTLKAYTDAGYSDLKWTYNRSVEVVWIKSDDPSYTVVLNNFDDGTVQGWAATNEAGNKAGYPTVAVATDYVLSAAYSLKMDSYRETNPCRSRLYKQFTTHATHDTIYAILDVRNGQAATHYGKNNRFQRDAVILVYLGRPYDAVAATYIPMDKWFRVVIPLPKNTTLEVRVILEYYGTGIDHSWLWLDDFKIISK